MTAAASSSSLSDNNSWAAVFRFLETTGSSSSSSSSSSSLLLVGGGGGGVVGLAGFRRVVAPAGVCTALSPMAGLDLPLLTGVGISTAVAFLLLLGGITEGRGDGGEKNKKRRIKGGWFAGGGGNWKKLVELTEIGFLGEDVGYEEFLDRIGDHTEL